MGKEKGGFLSPKAIANRIKSKGLQKLRWYCQMCQKQCRDENGFKCHLTSESHQRQLLLFAEDPDTYVDSFSKEFQEQFMELLSRRFGTKRVHANIVYQEYISDKDHQHMNSTQWETLTDFVKWLGKEGHCVVDETEKGWFIKWVDRNPETIQRQEASQKKEKMSMDDEEKIQKFIQQQIDRASSTDKPPEAAQYTELHRKNEDDKITLNLSLAAKKKPDVKGLLKKVSSAANPLLTSQTAEPGESSRGLAGQKTSMAGHKRKSALNDIMEMEEQKREKVNRKDYWLHAGVVVKVVTKKVGEKYYKKKGVLKSVDRFTGVVKMLDSGDKLKVDQEHLETVLPAIGKRVLVVNGAYRGSEAVLTGLNEKHFSCAIRIDSGTLTGRVVEGVQYEDVSKLHLPS